MQPQLKDIKPAGMAQNEYLSIVEIKAPIPKKSGRPNTNSIGMAMNPSTTIITVKTFLKQGFSTPGIISQVQVPSYEPPQT